MSRTGTESRFTANENRLEIIGYDDKDPLGPAFIVKSPMGHTLKISDTFAEMLSMKEISPASPKPSLVFVMCDIPSVARAFAIILYFFMTDFVKIASSTDHLKWSIKPHVWNVKSLVKASTTLSLLVIAVSFALLYVGPNIFHLTVADQSLYAFTFEILFYSAMLLIFNVRERGHFWSTRPSRTLFIAIISSMIAAIVVTTIGLPGLTPISPAVTLFAVSCSAVFSLIVNDLVKFLLVGRTETRW